MSRIHEALKKAAQERNDQASTRPVSDFLDLSTPGAAIPPPVDGHAPGRADRFAASDRHAILAIRGVRQALFASRLENGNRGEACS